MHLELFHPGDVGGEPVVEVAEGLLLLGPGDLGGGQGGGGPGPHGGGWARPGAGSRASACHYEVNLGQ